MMPSCSTRIARGVKRRFFWLKFLALLAAVSLLQGCIESIHIQGESTPLECRDASGVLRACTDSDRFVVNGGAIALTPQGTGTCGQMSIDFGDGTPPVTVSSYTLNPTSIAAVANHTYQGWPGTKTIRVRGVTDCSGDVTRTVNVRMAPNTIGFRLGLRQPNVAQCNVIVPNTPPIRAGSTVKIETDGRTMDYGPKPGGGRHVFNASGDPAAVVPPGYLFQRRKKFSLVYKIGSTDFQGETGPVFFQATQTGPLEICTNDNPSYLADNSGAMMLTITVNDVAP